MSVLRLAVCRLVRGGKGDSADLAAVAMAILAVISQRRAASRGKNLPGLVLADLTFVICSIRLLSLTGNWRRCGDY